MPIFWQQHWLGTRKKTPEDIHIKQVPGSRLRNGREQRMDTRKNLPPSPEQLDIVNETMAASAVGQRAAAAKHSHKQAAEQNTARR